MNLMTRAYEDIIEFIAGGSTPSEVIGFRPSAEARARVEELLDKQKQDLLAPEEASELDHYLHLEHLMRLAKARARAYLTHE
jgi:hypothetical protein